MPRTGIVKLKNPGTLSWAREELGLDIAHVAKRFNKTIELIAAWENGSDYPTFRQISDLADYYRRPLAAFFLPEIPPKEPKPKDFRTLPDVSRNTYSRETLIAYREVRNMIREASELFEDLNMGVSFSLPISSLEEDIDSQAEKLRVLLGITVNQQIHKFRNHYEAQDTWRNVLFNHGVLVRICRMPIIDARAFCVLHENLAGIGLSNQDREQGRIFSLFQEVYHLMLRQPGVSGIESRNNSPTQKVERNCDKFAASFLLPSSNNEVKTALKEFAHTRSLDSGRNIANKFKVSKYVVIRRALDMDLLDENSYWQLLTQWKQIDTSYEGEERRTDGGGNYYATQISYVGKPFIQLVMHALELNRLTPIQVKRLVGLDPSVLEASL